MNLDKYNYTLLTWEAGDSIYVLVRFSESTKSLSQCIPKDQPEDKIKEAIEKVIKEAIK